MNQSDKPSLQTSEEAIAASVPSSSKSPPSSSSSSSLWWPKRIHHSLSQHSSATTSNKSDNKGNSNSNNNNNNNTNDTNSSSMSITGDESESTQEFTLTNGRDNGNTISTCTFSSTGGRRRSAGENHLSSSSSFRDALVNSSNGDSFHSGIMRLDDIAKEKRKSQIKPAQYFETKQRIQEMLPISNLRFSSLGLIGREKETACLEACLERVTVPTAVRRSKDEPSMSTSKDEEESRVRRELVLISGDSGTGKTTLAETLLNPVTQRVGGLFVKGKFDIYRRNEPYSGIAGACREICGRIMSLLKRESCRSDDHNKRSECESNSWIQFQTILEVLVSKLGMENIRLLIHIIPELSEIVGEKLLVVAENVDVLNNNDATAGNGARLNYAFRIFMQVVANRLGPLVIFLDDIQWADTASIELLPVLLTGSDISNFMIIGAYRSNEVKDDDDHPFSKLITEMKLNNTDSATNNHEFNLTEIKLGNLTELQTNEMIMKVLSIDEPDTTIGLAKVCHKRSHGNIFSLLVFLDMLQMEGLLQYNLGLFRWDWDEQTILSQSAATANVVDVLTQKMKLLPSSARLGLSVAACLGYCFKPSILDTVLRALFANRCLNNSSTPLQTTADPSDESLQDPDETLEMLILGEREGFLEIENDGLTYRWIHDKVQEAAMSLVPLDDLPKLKAQVGSALVHELREEELAPYLFTVVNLLHEQGIPKIEVERVQLANLALQASKRASEASAFESAAKYVAIGLEALPTNAWANYYELTLDLYSTAAETASILGQKEDLEKYYAEVLSRTSSRLVDKFRVYHSMINFLSGALGKPLEAMKIIILILAQLGVSFPKHKIPRLMGTVSRFWALKKALSSVRREHIESLPTMKDSRQLEIMRLLDKLFLAAYLGKSDLIVMSVLASTRMTLENGLSEYSAPAFAELALLAGSAFGDVPLATKTGDFAQVVTAKVESKVMDCRTELFLCGFTRCWTDFIARMMPRLVHAYEVGLSVGDNENACWVSLFSLDVHEYSTSQ